jgi:hypothetical protein
MRNKTTHRTFAAILIGASIAGQVQADSMSWQEQRLLKPTIHQLAAERRGQVMIYDQMDAELVDEAIDAEFGRMQHMMFIRTQHRAPDGTVDEDDDC